MGRIRTMLTKRLTRELLSTHPEVFTEDFEKNKLLVNVYLSAASKKVRNVIAGYVTKQVKNKEVL